MKNFNGSESHDNELSYGDPDIYIAECVLNTKNGKTMLTTRAQIHHSGESRKFDSTLPDVEC